jgi:hypothetical protein
MVVPLPFVEPNVGNGATAGEPPRWLDGPDRSEAQVASARGAAADASSARPPREEQPTVTEPSTTTVPDEPPTGDVTPAGEVPPTDPPRVQTPPAVAEVNGATDYDDGPLPVRIPGQHMSHQPLVDDDAPAAEADPLRPYRVHELLTRHDQGKRRGRSEVPPSDEPVLEPVIEPYDPGPEGER